LIFSSIDEIAYISDELTGSSKNKNYDIFTGSWHSLELVSQWSRECNLKHAKCVPKVDVNARLPTRVIDVNPSDGSNIPYIYESKGERDLYLALIYCWGDSFRMLFTAGVDGNPSTYKKVRREIPLKLMPRTFKDAIQFTRGLKYRYRWIDALCIIQDLKEDMEKEIGRMDEIYKNAALTIAAAKGGNANHGQARRKML
jgi:hypothetical protein